jgi:hypothetical protein
MTSIRLPSALLAFLAVLWTAAAAVAPAVAQEPEAAPPLAAPEARGRLGGRVLGKDARTPVTGATVRAANLRTGTSVASAPTDAKGGFAIEGLPYGYVDLVVETAEGSYTASQVLNVPPDGRLQVTLALTRTEELPQGWWSGRAPRPAEGSAAPPIGVAVVQEEGRGFFRSRKGIAVLAGAGAVALLALSGGGGESPASPSQ